MASASPSPGKISLPQVPIQVSGWRSPVDGKFHNDQEEALRSELQQWLTAAGDSNVAAARGIMSRLDLETCQSLSTLLAALVEVMESKEANRPASSPPPSVGIVSFDSQFRSDTPIG